MDYVSKIKSLHSRHTADLEASKSIKEEISETFDAILRIDFEKFRLYENKVATHEATRALNEQFRDEMKRLIDLYNCLPPLEQIDLSVDISAYQERRTFRSAFFEVGVDWVVTVTENNKNGYIVNEIDDEINAFIRQNFNRDAEKD